MKLDAARQMAVEPQDSQQLEQCDTDPTKLDYASLFGNPPIPSEPPTSVKQGSRLCQQGDLATDGYRYWMSRMREPLSLNRKMWEWFFIADALFQRGKLAPGHRGIAFGVGLEPLSSLFAAFGAQVLATDMAEDGAATAGWIGQHAASLQALNQRGLCDDASFREKVNFRVLDMNDLPRDLEAGFDFCWSSCALEHIGSLEHGMRFVERAMDLLRPGGVAVHTTEFNMSSNDQTFESAGLSLYRRRDLDALFLRLQGLGYRVEPINWDEGSGFADGHIDLPPYYFTKVHLRLEVASYICTSIGFIVWKQ
jgi:SAM-dependent methyltransferase